MNENSTIAIEEAPQSARSERGEQKYAQVLEGARAVFLSRGFEGASVDEIARSAGISKATLYRHFPDKEALFQAVIAQECQRQAALHPAICDAGLCFEDFLIKLAKESIEFSLGEFGRGIYRIAVAESARFPQIGESFYKTGFKRNRNRFTPALAAAMERGELMDVDPDYAANVFFSICKADIFHRRLFGIDPEPSAADIDQLARRSVATFLRAFAPVRTENRATSPETERSGA